MGLLSEPATFSVSHSSPYLLLNTHNEMTIRKLASIALQLSGVLSFAWAMHYQVYRINMPEKLSPTRNQFGGVWKYLTFLNMLLQFIFFTIALLSNFTKRLHGVRDLVFASAAFPIGMFVGIIFWSIWAVDRELIFPKVLDQYFPAILNHLMHTTVIPLQLGQLLLVKHNFPSRSKGFTITAILCLGYLVWINYIYYMTGFWVYPVIKVLSAGQRIVFFAFCGFLGGVLFLIGDIANKMIWGRSVN